MFNITDVVVFWCLFSVVTKYLLYNYYNYKKNVSSIHSLCKKKINDMLHHVYTTKGKLLRNILAPISK